MEFAENEFISEEWSDYLKTFTNGVYKENYEFISISFGLSMSIVCNLVYRKIIFKKEYTDAMIEISKLAIRNRNKTNGHHNMLRKYLSNLNTTKDV